MPSTPSTLDDDVRVFVYRFMVENGRPPVPIEIGTALGTGSAEIETALKRLADAHVLVLAPGTPYIWLANPLSALPSPFPVTVRDRQYFGICFWDALGVVAMLGDEGTVTCLCPDCGDELTVRVQNGRVEPSHRTTSSTTRFPRLTGGTTSATRDRRFLPSGRKITETTG